MNPPVFQLRLLWGEEWIPATWNFDDGWTCEVPSLLGMLEVARPNNPLGYYPNEEPEFILHGALDTMANISIKVKVVESFPILLRPALKPGQMY